MTRTAVVAGVGPGLGESVARTFAEAGCAVGLFARSSDLVDDLEADLHEAGHDALAVPCDVTDPTAVGEGFAAVREAFGPVDVLVYNPAAASWQGLRDISTASFERTWRVGAYGALLCAKEAVADMLDGDGGTVVFTGATSAVRGRGGALGFSSAKFAARGMAESMARELGPEGVHVAHAVIDGQILPRDGSSGDRPAEEYLDPDAIAETYWQLVEQDRSAWTLELDLRPHVESF